MHKAQEKLVLECKHSLHRSLLLKEGSNKHSKIQALVYTMCMIIQINPSTGPNNQSNSIANQNNDNDTVSDIYLVMIEFLNNDNNDVII